MQKLFSIKPTFIHFREEFQMWESVVITIQRKGDIILQNEEVNNYLVGIGNIDMIRILNLNP